MDTSEKLRARRGSLGLTQAEVARRAKMSTVQYNGYETARHEPSEKTMARLARVLGSAAETLWGDEEEDEDASGSIKIEIAALKRRISDEMNIDIENVKIEIIING